MQLESEQIDWSLSSRTYVWLRFHISTYEEVSAGVSAGYAACRSAGCSAAAQGARKFCFYLHSRPSCAGVFEVSSAGTASIANILVWRSGCMGLNTLHLLHVGCLTCQQLSSGQHSCANITRLCTKLTRLPVYTASRPPSRRSTHLPSQAPPNTARAVSSKQHQLWQDLCGCHRRQ